MDEISDEEFERICMEKRARERVAWGAYAAQSRQEQFDEKLRKIKDPKERREFIERGREANRAGFYIG